MNNIPLKHGSQELWPIYTSLSTLFNVNKADGLHLVLVTHKKLCHSLELVTLHKYAYVNSTIRGVPVEKVYSHLLLCVVSFNCETQPYLNSYYTNASSAINHRLISNVILYFGSCESSLAIKPQPNCPY